MLSSRCVNIYPRQLVTPISTMTNPFISWEPNPFLMAIDEEQQPATSGSGSQQLAVTSHHTRCKLPDFWPNNPVLWFSRAEFNFEVAGVVEQWQKFMYTVNALPYDALTLVADLVTAPPAVDPYTALKDQLLISHKLTAVQMADKILDMLSLGDRRPSQLLAVMLEYCPEGESDSAFFRASFFRRLPKEIQVLMANEVNGDLKEMATGRRWWPLSAGILAVARRRSLPRLWQLSTSKARSSSTRRLTRAVPSLAAVAAPPTLPVEMAAATTSCVTATGSMARKLTAVTSLPTVSGRETSQPGGGGSLHFVRRLWSIMLPV